MNQIKNKNNNVKVAIAGVGNCASSLVQGIAYYSNSENEENEGLIIKKIGPYKISDIQIVAAFDVDERKVGKKLEEAVFSDPNSTLKFFSNLPSSEIIVKMGPQLDGISPIMKDFPKERSFRVAQYPEVDVAEELRNAGADVLLCYLPVGSDQGAKHYASACLDSGVAFINCMPSFIASNIEWANRFAEKGIPIIGDDVKSQIGATIIHQALTSLMVERGCKINRTYQLNSGGNTDFLNMLDRSRVKSKIKSKTNAIQSQMSNFLKEDEIHIGPSDYVPWLNDNKIAFIRIEGVGFGNAPIKLDLKLSVHDSPNSAAVVMDVIRIAKVALDRGLAGPLEEVCSYYMKSPPVQYKNNEARQKVIEFLKG